MKKVVIIGAGIAGLSAGIYAQKSGFDVTICEQHSMSGGMCTSWRRKGYLFEGTLHWLTGSSEKTGLYKIWNETGALNPKVKIQLKDPFRMVESVHGPLFFYRDIEKTVKQLLPLYPKEKKHLLRLMQDVKTIAKLETPAENIKHLRMKNKPKIKWSKWLKMTPAFFRIVQLSNQSCKDYLKDFSPELKNLFKITPDNFNAAAMFFTFGTIHAEDAGYPEGGSLPMIKRMEETFLAAGGKLHLKTKVKKVNIQQGKVNAVEGETEVFPADAVVVTQETIAANKQLFEQPLTEKWIQEICRNTKPAVCTFICIGIREKLEYLPVWNPKKPLEYANRTHDTLDFNLFSDEDGFAPKGCTALTMEMLGDTYKFWKKAKKEGRYEQEKENLAQQISDAFEEKFPGYKEKIEVIDIATPLTYERYTSAYHGSWMSVFRVGEILKRYPGDVSSVKGLYFAGHRMTKPGGLPIALVSGRKAAQLICRQFDQEFST
ncbi:hypothetical protein FACS189418_0250 [Clostridia bacterium]|nr:hypothetical protein FACS189418_0250 [Clostridia bacterium]